MLSTAPLSDPKLLIVFATSPTGLGHLRVIEALSHGLPKTVSPVLIGGQDQTVDAFYRFTSNHRLSVSFMSWVQNGSWSGMFASAARYYLATQTRVLHKQLLAVLAERLTVPDTILLVAAHNTLAYQLSVMKKKLAQETHARVVLAVQVTDDSPQPMWYIPGADMLFVPSEHTKTRLQEYARKADLPRVPITAAAYPISPVLAEPLPLTAFKDRGKQVDPQSKATIHMCIPISGAAVGIDYTTHIVRALHKLTNRFHFHIVAKKAPYTKPFLATMEKLPYVTPITAPDDRSIVALYETVYQQETLAFEITKPSEQAYKVLASPQHRGGALMLFTEPVGQQETDNIHFLQRHHLLPTIREQAYLWEQAATWQTNTLPLIRKAAHSWRAVQLPKHPGEAANFIYWCLQQKIFATMMEYHRKETQPELQANGVTQFWDVVVEKLQKDESKLVK